MRITTKQRYLDICLVASILFAVFFVMCDYYGPGYTIVESQAHGGGIARDTGWSHRGGCITYMIIHGYRSDFRDTEYGPSPFVGWLTYPAIGRVPAVTFISLDVWVLALPFLGLAFWSVKRTGRLQQLSAGRCALCGYDLRAHKPGQKCPECGTEIPRPVGAR
jgi:hypothetical protein